MQFMQYSIFNEQQYEEAHESLPPVVGPSLKTDQVTDAGVVYYNDWEQSGIKRDLSSRCSGYGFVLQ